MYNIGAIEVLEQADRENGPKTVFEDIMVWEYWWETSSHRFHKYHQP